MTETEVKEVKSDMNEIKEMVIAILTNITNKQ
jgi:hypothetical protein